MTLSAAPVMVLEHNENLIDSVGGFSFYNSSGVPEFVPGKIGNCITRTLGSKLVRHACVDIPLLSVFSGNFTIFGWIRHTIATGTATADMAARNYTNSNIVGPRLVFNDPDSVSVVAQINNVSAQTFLHAGAGIGNQWHFIALSRRASDNRFRLYFDGTMDAEWTNPFSPLIRNGDNGTNDTDVTCINRFWVNGSTSAATEHDQTGVANVEYSQQDISYLFNFGNGIPLDKWEVNGRGSYSLMRNVKVF